MKVILEPSAKRDIRRLDEQTKRRVILTPLNTTSPFLQRGYTTLICSAINLPEFNITTSLNGSQSYRN